MASPITCTAAPVWLRIVPDNLHQIGEADKSGERGIFRQGEILADQRRHDDAHRLWNDHPFSRLRFIQTSAAAASLWPRATDCTPARTISAI